MAAELQGAEDLQKALKTLAARLDHLSPILKEIANTTLNHIDERFEAQGPGWAPNAPATLMQGYRGKPIKNKGILHRSGHLRDSFTHDVSDHHVTIGTNVAYAPIHHFGGQAGKNHKVKIPARPFMPIDPQGHIQTTLSRQILADLKHYLAQ